MQDEPRSTDHSDEKPLPNYIIPELHEAVRQVLVEHLETADFAEAASERGRELLGLGEPCEAGVWFAAECVLNERLLGPEHSSTLSSRGNLAECYRAAGFVAEALVAMEGLVLEFARVMGPEHPKTLVSRNNLVECYRTAGFVAEVIQEQEQLAQDCTRVLGPVHQYTLTVRNNLSMSYAKTGRIADSVREYERVLQDCINMLGADHPLTVLSLDTLASSYLNAGRVGDSSKAYETLVRTRTRVLGPEHLETLNCRANLAESHRHAGQVNEAIQEQEHLVRDMTRLLGPEHPDTLAIRFNLATSYRTAGRANEVIQSLMQLMQDCADALGPEHPHTLACRSNLAEGLRFAGLVDEAIQEQERLVQDCTELLGPEHPDTLTSRNNLACSYRDAGRLSEAIQEHELLVQDYTEVLGSEHPTTLTQRGNLAGSYSAAGRAEEAIYAQERLVLDCERVLGRRHPYTLTSRSNLAESYHAVGRIMEALHEQERLIQDRTEVLGPEHPDTLTSRNNLADSYRLVGRVDDAIKEQETLVRDSTRVRGPEHPQTLVCRNNLAESYRNAGQMSNAIHEQTLLVEDQTRTLGPEHPDTLTSRSNLIASYRYAGLVSEAIQEQERLVQVCKKVLGPEHPDTLTSRNNLAESYRDAGRLNEAIQELERLVHDCTEVLGAEYPITRISCGNLAMSYLGAGQIALAESQLEDFLRTCEQQRVLGGDAVGRAMTVQVMAMHTMSFLLAKARVCLGQQASLIVAALERGSSRAVLDLLQQHGLDRRAAARELVSRGCWSEAKCNEYDGDLDRVVELELRDKALVDRRESPESHERQKLACELKAVRERLTTVEREMLPSADPSSLEAIRTEIQCVEVLLLFGWCHMGVTAVVVPHNEQGDPKALWVSEVTLMEGETPFQACKREEALIAEMQAAALEVRDCLLGARPAEELAAASREFLDFALPVEARALLSKASRVIVVPSGPLNDLPLDLLAELAGVEELRGKPIVTAPSGSIFAMLRERGVQDGPFWPGIVGDPDFGAFGGEGGAEADRGRSGGGGGDRGGGLDESNPPASRRPLTELDLLVRDGEGTLERLPRARTEAEQIAKYFGKARQVQVRPLVDADATVPRVREESSGKRVLHLAAHAVLGSMKDPMASAVVLAQEHGEDGTVRPGLLRLDMLLTHWGDRLKGCDLVVLSCCQTGRGVKLGDSTMALPIGFFHAGCKCVIASAWKVHDLATCLLMMRFYQNLLGVHEDHVGRPETRVRDVFGKRYAPGQAMPVTHALQEAKEWLKALSYDELADFQEAHPAPEVEPKVHPQQATDQPSPANKNGLKTAEQEFMEAAKRNKKEPPFKHPRFWAAWIIVGDPG